jgi:predicted membrane metal-binding protein
MGAALAVGLFKDFGLKNAAESLGGGNQGKCSGSWKRFKDAVAWWFKKILIVLAIFIGSALLLFLIYKFYMFQRRKSLTIAIAKLQAELET